MINSNNKAKIIFHIDLNAFFCSVAEILNPYLKNKAFAIGRENSIKGVISTASYEARKYGINSAMPLIEAFNILPSLIVVSPDYKHYEDYQCKFVNLIKGYSSLVEIASIDEVYVDMTEKCMSMHPLSLAKEIQTRLINEYNLPCSIGIAPTLFLAKMASNLKKPLGISVLRKREIKDYLYDLSIKDIFGIGKKTYPKLINKKINTIKDFLDVNNKYEIIKIIGDNHYYSVVSRLEGKSSNIVDPNRHSVSESISTSQTFDQPKNNEEDIIIELRQQMKDLHKKMVMQNLYAKTISITLRDASFKTITRSKTIDYTNDLYIIIDIVTDLVEDNYNGAEMRLVGCGLSNLIDEKKFSEVYNLFTYENFIAKDEKLDDIFKEFNKKYGTDFIAKGLKK